MSVRKEVSSPVTTPCLLPLSPDLQLTGIQCMEKSLKGKKRKSESGSFHQKNERLTEVDERKSKSESSDSRSDKLASKHVNECSQEVCAPKDDYIHVRAKRGQATNSHSLAERVRREKISERMRLLQDLVPGCNKITGKALMLDEIINYVQSLQRQIEFLSMKLAAVNPELNFDIEQIVTKDMFHSRDGSLAAFEYPLGMNILHPHFHGSSSHGIMQSEMPMSDIPNSADVLGSNISQLPSVWDNELHNILQMGFIPNPPPLAGSDPNGTMEMEL